MPDKITISKFKIKMFKDWIPLLVIPCISMISLCAVLMNLYKLHSALLSIFVSWVTDICGVFFYL